MIIQVYKSLEFPQEIESWIGSVVFSIGVALWTLCYMMVRRQYSNLHQHLCVIILVAGNEQQKWLWWCFCYALSLSATTNLAPLNFLEHELDLFLRELKHLFHISQLLLHHQKPTLWSASIHHTLSSRIWANKWWLKWWFCHALSLPVTTNPAPFTIFEHEMLFLMELKHQEWRIEASSIGIYTQTVKVATTTDDRPHSTQAISCTLSSFSKFTPC